MIMSNTENPVENGSIVTLSYADGSSQDYAVISTLQYQGGDYIALVQVTVNDEGDIVDIAGEGILSADSTDKAVQEPAADEKTETASAADNELDQELRDLQEKKEALERERQAVLQLRKAQEGKASINLCAYTIDEEGAVEIQDIEDDDTYYAVADEFTKIFKKLTEDNQE